MLAIRSKKTKKYKQGMREVFFGSYHDTYHLISGFMEREPG